MTNNQLSPIDALFGVKIVSIGEARLRVRRILTKEQQRGIIRVQEVSVVAGEAIRNLQEEFQGRAEREAIKSGKSLEEAELSESDLNELRVKVAEHEINICNALVPGIQLLCLDEIPELETLSLNSLGYLFRAIRDSVEESTDDAIKDEIYPTNGV
jgi:hypothetical protein